MPNPKIEKYERMLHAMPRDFRELATWGWTQLRADIHQQALKAGAEPELAIEIASRLARLVVGQVYQDITIARNAAAAAKH